MWVGISLNQGGRGGIFVGEVGVSTLAFQIASSLFQFFDELFSFISYLYFQNLPMDLGSGGGSPTPEFIKRLADHIAVFSLIGMQAVGRRKDLDREGRDGK